MKTTPQKLIDDYTNRGWWGAETATTLFERAVADVPDRLALADPLNRSALVAGDAQRFSYSEASVRIEATAAALHANGIRADDIVVVQLPNIVELPITFLALARLGAIVSPVPVQYGRHELNAIQQSLNAAAFVSLYDFKGQDLLTEHASASPSPPDSRWSRWRDFVRSCRCRRKCRNDG